MRNQRLGLFLGFCSLTVGQAPDPAYPFLERAYEAVRAKDWDRAIVNFDRALEVAPTRAGVHKDAGYALLKTGQTEAARDHFKAAADLDPTDEHVALEYAFLCYETRQPVQARRTFDALRQNAKSADAKATAVQAFENVDRPLRDGIVRWQQVVAATPDNFSAHEELARLAEQRDDWDLSAQHFERAWRLRPDHRRLMVDLGRVWLSQKRDEQAIPVLLAASRGSEPYVAEEARALLPPRYPYIYEFQKALEWDPANTELRREFAYLQLQMGNQASAEDEFAAVLVKAPEDLLSAAQLGFLRLNRGDQTGGVLLDTVLQKDNGALADRVREVLKLPPVVRTRGEESVLPTGPRGAKLLAESSLEKGFLEDALKYLKLAHEDDPVDFGVMLKLGWTYNILKNDREAVKWFNLARRSPDLAVAEEAGRAYRNLAPGLVRVRSTFWAFPMVSTRWSNMFTYAQAKTEFFPQAAVRPYLSVRFVGDLRGKVQVGGSLAPQFLSERSAIVAVGLATRTWKGITAWGEAGEAFRYRLIPGDSGRMVPDYRGGLVFAKGFGKMLGGTKGWFFETNDDAVYVHRFQRNTLFYTQNRSGYTFRAAEGFGAFQAQLLWNWNVTADLKRQEWANFAETGPGVRFRFNNAPGFLFTVNAFRGTYTVDQGIIRPQRFSDIRVGIWYALTQ